MKIDIELRKLLFGVSLEVAVNGEIQETPTIRQEIVISSNQDPDRIASSCYREA